MASATSDDRSTAPSLKGSLLGLPGYGVAILATTLALGLTYGLRYTTGSPTFFLFYAAIFVSVWFCGRGPGWVAAGLAALALLSIRFPMTAEDLAATSTRIPTVMTFALCAFAADWLSTRRRRTEAALRATRDGLERTVLERTQALRKANQALSTEIEERRNVEAALRASEKFWPTIFEASNVPMGMATVSGRDRVLNEAAQRLLGYSHEEQKSLTIAGITHEDDREHTMPVFEQLRAGVVSDYHVVKRYRRKDGDVRWVDATVTRVPNPRGGEDLIFAIFPDITELKRAEAELREANESLHAREEWWRRMFEFSNMAMAVTDLEGHHLMINQATHEMFGYTQEEHQNISIAELTHEDDRERTLPLYEQLARGERRAYRVVKRYRRKDGRAIWADLSITRVPDPRAGRDVAVAMLVDVTDHKRVETELREANELLRAEIKERRRVETALRASEEWWRRIFETSSVPISVTDLNGHHVMVNRATERTLGYTLEELKSISIRELTHEDDRSRTLPDFDALISGKRKEYHVINRYRCKDGSVKWLDASVTRVRDPQSGDDVVAAIVADITEQKRVEAELRASEERWRAMFEHAPVAIAMVRNDHRLIETNPGYHRLLGYTEEEFRELTPIDISFESDRDATQMLLPKLIDGTIKAARTEKRYRARDGSAVWADATFFHVPATEGSPAFATAIVVDITERKRAEEALRRTQSELARAARIMSMGELTASIAHEVNQPLAAIVASGNACRRWLATEPPNLTRAKESLNRIVEDANRASEVITRVRAHTKNTLPEQVEVWINDIVEDVLFFTRGELEARLISLQMELDRDVAPVLGDKVQLQQVILNLVMNAVEAMTPITGRQRILTMKSRKMSPIEVQVMVRDNGPGLNLDDSDRIFDTFFTTKPNGMGMGLSISRSIIEAHSGRLWTLPASPHGVEFHLALPTLRVRGS